MEMWTALGIEKTKDIDAITAAYHEKLKYVHPEEKPEEFMALRSEYEEALKYANEKDEGEEEKEKTPVDLWLERVDDVYNHYQKRIDINNWRELFSDDVCEAVDSRIDARDALLRYLMKNDALPRDIWQLIDKEFSIIENKEALYEIFPKDYVDNCLISGINNDPHVPYELFDADTTGNPDCYFNLYFKAREEVRNRDAEAALATIRDIENTGIKHPYTDLLLARLAINTGENEKALELLDDLVERHPEDPGIRANHADALSIAGRNEEAIVDYEFALSKNYKAARYNQADCLMKLERYVDAKDLMIQLVTEYPFEENFKKFFDDACEKAKAQYEQKFAEGTLGFDDQYEYAWLCFQSDENEKTESIVNQLTPETIAQRCDIQNLKSKLYSNLNMPEKALENAVEWEKAIAELPEGETEKEKKRKNKLDDIFYIQAIAYAQLEKFDEALEKAAASIEAGPSRRSNAHDLRRTILRSQKRDYLGALHEAEKMVEVNPGSWSYYILGVEQYELDMLQAAFNSFGESLNYTLELGVYIYRTRILCDAEQWDGAQEIVDYLEEHDIHTDSVNYCKARILEGKGEKEEALNMYNSIIENFENGNSDINFIYEVYSRAAELQENSKSAEELLEMVNKGLEVRCDYYPLLYFKTTLLEKQNKPQSAIDVYNRIEEYYPGRYNLHVGLANNYYDLYDYENALLHYSKRLEISESAGLHDMVGLCLTYLRRFDEAEEHFNAAVEMDPENVRFRTNLGTVFECRFDFEKAIDIHAKAVEINDQKSEDNRKVYVNRVYARALARAGRFDAAADMYLKNLEMFGRLDDARYVIEVYIESKQLDKAEKYIKQYKAEGKLTENQYWLMLGDVYRLAGSYKQYRKCMFNLPDNDEPRFDRLGNYYMHEGNYKKALEFYEKRDKVSPDSINSFNDRLFCLRKLGKNTEAKILALHALEVLKKRSWSGDEYALYLTKQAFVYTSSGYPEKAKPFIDEAMTVPLCDHCRYPKCKDAYLALAEYYEEIGEYDKAIETCNEAAQFALDEYDFVYIPERIRKEHKKELKKENRK